MNTIKTLIILISMAGFSTSCSKTGLLSKGEKINIELEGDWEPVSYHLNNIDAKALLEDMYFVFAPSVSNSLEGKFISIKKDEESQFENYVLNEEGSIISINESENQISLSGDLLTISQTLKEDGQEIFVELVLDKQ